jgi:hypothetical protein
MRETPVRGWEQTRQSSGKKRLKRAAALLERAERTEVRLLLEKTHLQAT